MVAELVKLEPINGALTAEQVAAWKTNLQQLIQQGPQAVPAIREFFSKNMDYDYGPGGRQVLGYGSAAEVMIDALAQIGGPEALGVMAGVLQTTADPREIALLALGMDKLDPGQHRQEALTAAREALAMAAGGKLTDTDVSPLFEVFQKYGDAATVAELQRNTSPWNYYSVIALAQLPDGAGLPALIEMATAETTGSSTRGVALQMLAQLASDSPDARQVFLEQVRQNKLTPYNWATLAPILAGDQLHFAASPSDNTMGVVNKSDVMGTHIVVGNQNFYTAPTPGTLTAQWLSQQAAFIDQLSSATTDPAAVQALQQAKVRLAQRQAGAATTAGGQP
jgi:hypothetical protein